MAADSRRVYFLDNLRSLMVVMVLVFHAGTSYSAAVDFWPFHDGQASGAINFFMFVCDVFMMSVLFFIAGYFALPSLQKHGTAKFLTGKLKRLGLPWVVITVTLLPAMDYVHYLRSTAEAMTFPQFWLLSVRRIGVFKFGWLDMSRYFSMPESFYQRYMWYVSLLLAVFAVFALSRRVDVRLPKWSRVRAAAVTTAVVLLLFTATRITYRRFMDSGWFSLGNLIQFQLGKLVIYIGCFALGVFAFEGDWFADGRGIGNPSAWLTVCGCLFGMSMVVLKGVSAVDNPALGWKLGFCVLYPLWTLSFVGAFVSAARKWANGSTALTRSMSQNSYKMYLVHYMVPFLLPLGLADVRVGAGAKFGCTAVATLAFSYVMSRFALAKLPL